MCKKVSDLIKENRIGIVSISDSLFNDMDLKMLEKIMGKFISVKAEHFFHNGTFEYLALSSSFRKVPLGDEAPKYLVNVEPISSDKGITIVDYLINFLEVK